MTGMEQFNLQSRQSKFKSNSNLISGASKKFYIYTNVLVEPANNKKKGANNISNNNPLTNSMAHGSQFANNKNPGTSHIDNRGAKIFEIYSSGKTGPAPAQV